MLTHSRDRLIALSNRVATASKERLRYARYPLPGSCFGRSGRLRAGRVPAVAKIATSIGIGPRVLRMGVIFLSGLMSVTTSTAREFLWIPPSSA